MTKRVLKAFSCSVMDRSKKGWTSVSFQFWCFPMLINRKFVGYVPQIHPQRLLWLCILHKEDRFSPVSNLVCAADASSESFYTLFFFVMHVSYFSSAMIVFFPNSSKQGNISIYLVGPGNFPFRFEKTTSWQASSWHDTACVNRCCFQSTLFIVNLLNSLWEQTCSPLSNRHSCTESRWPNRAHCALRVQGWDVKSGQGQCPQKNTWLLWGHLCTRDWQ